MGREALTWAQAGRESGEVRALLESTELVLRGAVRRRFPCASLVDVHVEDERLLFRSGSETVALHLGIAVASSWARVIMTPPPSLRSKLGLAKGARAFCMGAFDDAPLQQAVLENRSEMIGDADMMIVCLDGPATLEAALEVHGSRPLLPLWTIYPKGRDVAFGDRQIREWLRSLGFRDSKSCAVSDTLTATRYGRAVRAGCADGS